MFYLFIFSRKN